MANGKFTKGLKTILDRSDTSGGVDFDTNTLMLALGTALPTQSNYDSWQYWSDVTGFEVSGTGYVSGGTALTGVVVTADTTNHRGAGTAPSVTFSTVTLSGVVAGIVYKSNGGTAASSPLIGCYDFGGTANPSAANLVVSFTGGTAFYLG